MDKYKELKEGQEFKNYKEFCNFLDIEPASGNAKKAQLKEIERYCEFSKNGHSITITNIFDEPLPPTNVSQNYAQRILMELLVDNWYNTGKIEMDITANQLYLQMNMINNRYLKYSRKKEDLSEDYGLNIMLIEEFYSLFDNKINYLLKKTLNNMEDRALIKYEEVYFSNKGKMSADEISRVTRNETLVLDTFRRDYPTIRGKQDIIMHGMWKEYYSKVASLNDAHLGIKYYYKAYNIIYTSQIDIQTREFIESTVFNDFNNLIAEDYMAKRAKKMLELEGGGLKTKMDFIRNTYKETYLQTHQILTDILVKNNI